MLQISAAFVVNSITDELQIFADAYNTGIDRLSPTTQTTAVECTKSDAEAKEMVGDDIVTVGHDINILESGFEAGSSGLRSSEKALVTGEHGSNKAHIQVDDNEGYASDHEKDTAKGKIKIEGTSQSSEDEGYVSAEDSLGCPEKGPEHLSVRQPQMGQVVRSAIFEPLGSLDRGEIARPPLLACLTASALSLPLSKIPHRPSNGDRRLSSFPGLQTFDDIPGLRRQPLSRAETMRLVTISAETTSRAHHHWLRPCAACVRKAGAESKGWHLLPKTKTGDNTKDERSVEGAKEPSVYKRTADWVKKQEERIKHL
ncbi:hypothetical protein MMC15_001963 [Xylographa vitiligo]|nr:hypothetical protein [Xylographa vitiligo]